MRDRFLAGADNALPDYELLELLLFFALPKIDTKPVAKQLLGRFGSLAGVVVLLLWLWLSCLVVLLGAEINAEAEQQTVRDTTVGPERPLGQRRAVKADTVPGEPGPARSQH